MAQSSSLFAARSETSDAQALFDTNAVRERAVRRDWLRASRREGLKRIIAASDPRVALGQVTRETLLDEVLGVLLRYKDVLRPVFTYYCARGEEVEEVEKLRRDKCILVQGTCKSCKWLL